MSSNNLFSLLFHQNSSISDLITYLKSSFLEEDFHEVEEVLIRREADLKRVKDEMENDLKNKIFMSEAQMRDLRQKYDWMEEKFLKLVEESEKLDDKSTARKIDQLVKENKRLMLEKEELRLAEQENLEELNRLRLENAKLNAQVDEGNKSFDDLQKRVSKLEEELKPWLSREDELNCRDGEIVKENGRLQIAAGQSHDIACHVVKKEPEDSNVKYQKHVKKVSVIDIIDLSDSEDDDHMPIANILKRKQAPSKPLNVRDIDHGDDVCRLAKTHKNQACKDKYTELPNHCPSAVASPGCHSVTKSVISTSQPMSALKRCDEKPEAESRKHTLGVVLIDENSEDDSSDLEDDYAVKMLIANCRRKMGKMWEYEADLLYALDKDDELCMKAVCVLYRQYHKLNHGPFLNRSEGFNHFLSRGVALAKYLSGGDPNGGLRKSVSELKEHDPDGLRTCRDLAKENYKQLFSIYKKKMDPLFP